MKHLYSLLSNIQSGIVVRHKLVHVKRTKMNLEVLNLLYSEGFINGFSISENKPHHICVFLKYVDDKPVLRKFRIISTSSKRVYVSYETIVKQLANNGLFVLSTNRYGLTLTDDYLRHSDIFIRTGGELLFQIIF